MFDDSADETDQIEVETNTELMITNGETSVSLPIMDAGENMNVGTTTVSASFNVKTLI